jgi:hypothetical protein
VTGRRRGRGVELACLAVGVALLAGLAWRIGLGTLAADLRALGWGLAVVVALHGLDVACNTAGWALGFPRGERPVGAAWLFLARLAGDAANYLTPTATVGGELLRVRLLGPRAAAGVRWASVGVAKLGQTVGQAMFVLLGLGALLPRLTAAAAGPVVLAGASLALAVGAGTVWLVGRGVWAAAEGVSRRLGLARWIPASWAAGGRELDAALRRLGPGRVALGLLGFVAGWAVGAVEVYVVLAWIGAPVDWATALAVETGAVLIDGIVFFVPAKLGTQEGGKVLVFAALGLDPARGFTLGVVRRIRELVYAGLGLAALALLAGRAERP